MESGILDFPCQQNHCPVFKLCQQVPTQVLNGKGRKEDLVLFVGEAPGRNEAQMGLPFMGKAGQLLRRTLKIVNKNQVSLAYSNAARYNPRAETGNIPPNPEAVEACHPNLLRDIETLRQEYNLTKIVLLGNTALRAFFPNADGVQQSRGRHFKHDSIDVPFFVTFHPSYVNRTPGAYGRFKDDLSVALGAEAANSADQWRKPYAYKLLTKIEDVETWVEQLLTNPKTETISLDTETLNVNVRYGNKLGTLQFSDDGELSTVIPYDHPENDWSLDDRKKLDELLVKLFTQPEPAFKRWVFHNFEFDLRMLFNFGPGVVQLNRPVYDTMCMAYAQDENRGKSGINKPYSLESLLRDYIGVEKFEDSEIESLRGQGRLLEIELERLAKYGASDAVYTWRLFYVILERAERENYKEKLLKLARHWFSPVTQLTAIMSSNGFWVDMDQLRLLGGKKSPILIRMAEIEEEFKQSKACQKTNKMLLKAQLGGKMATLPFKKATNWVFDINKDESRMTLFFEVLGLEPVDSGKGLWRGQPRGKLDKKFQERYAPNKLGDPNNVKEVDLLKEYSGLKKLKTSYVQSIFEFLDPRTKKEGTRDNRVRPKFWLTSTDTGRSSCSSPNLQQLPKANSEAKAQIKSMMAAEPGTALIQLDFKVNEVRWFGILSQDESLTQAFAIGGEAFASYIKMCDSFYERNTNFSFSDLKLGMELIKGGDVTSYEPQKRARIEKLLADNDFIAVCKAKELASLAGDIHKSNGSLMFEVPIGEVTKDQRDSVKSITFGLLFGRGVKALAEQLHESNLRLVQDKIDKFFSQFKQAGEWLNDIEVEGETNGFVESPIGRRRRLLTFLMGLNDDQEIARAKRICRNAPIQGVASDAAFLGAMLFQKWLIKNRKWVVHPTLQHWKVQNVVHDSMLVQVPIEDVPEAVGVIRPFFTTKLEQYMTKCWPNLNFNIHPDVDFEVGVRWGHMQSFDGSKVHLGHLMDWLRCENAKRIPAQES